jgi:hypothetical protein
MRIDIRQNNNPGNNFHSNNKDAAGCLKNKRLAYPMLSTLSVSRTIKKYLNFKNKIFNDNKWLLL